MPRLRFDVRGFRTVLGRRMLVLFVLCALLPMLAFSADAYRRVAEGLRAQAREQLQQSTKAAGMSILERLHAARAELELFARSPGDPPPMAALLGAVERVRHGHLHTLVGTAFAPPPLTDSLRARLATGASALVLQPSDAGARVFLGRAIGPGDVIWGLVSIDSLVAIARLYGDAGPGAADRLCLLAGETPLAGCDQPAGGAPAAGSGARAPAPAPERLVGRWQIFLRAGFAAPPWQVRLSADTAAAPAPLLAFRRSLLRILLLSLAAVLLLSQGQIRRRLEPLERLADAARRLARRDFAARARVTSGDEFEEVAEVFNGMVGELGRQFAALDTINRLDRTVLATLDRTRVLDELVACVGAVAPSDALVLVSWDPGSPGEAQLHAAVPGIPASRTTRRLSLAADERQALSAVVGADAAAPLPARIEAPLLELAGAGGSRLALPVGMPARAILLLANREAGAYGPEDRVRGGQLADQLAVVLRTLDLIADRAAVLDGVLLALARAIDAKSSWTAGHSERVATLSLAVGRELKLDERELDRLQRGALLHDLGKIGIPAGLLDKPDRLTAVETERLRSHVAAGMRILEPIAALADILPIVGQHHERWDGSGYPAGLRGDAIDPLARIVAVVDVFDSLASDRPYRAAFGAAAVRELLRRAAGMTLDPQAVASFLRVLPLEAA